MIISRKTPDRVIDFIAGHSRATRKRVTELMNCSDNMSNDVGTILFGKEAVRRRDHRCSGRRFPGTWGAAPKSGKGRSSWSKESSISSN